MPAAPLSVRLQRNGPECDPSVTRFRLAFGFGAAYRTIELANFVRANLEDAVLRALKDADANRQALQTGTELLLSAGELHANAEPKGSSSRS